MRSRLLAASAVTALSLAGATSADATIWTATVDDAANDTSDLRADHDLRQATFSYDDAANQIVASARLGEPPKPGDKTFMILRFATLVENNTNCAGRATGLLTELGPGGQSRWAAASASGAPEGQGAAARADNGATVALSAQVPLLAQIRPGCVWAQIVGGDPQNPTRIDITEPLTVLKPAATPPPAPTPPAPAKLSLSVKSVEKVKRNRWVTTRATIANKGGSPASGLKLSLKRAKGVSVRIAGAKSGRTSRTLPGTLAAGQRRTVSVRLRLGRTAKRSSRIRYRVSAPGGLSASRTVTLRRR